MPRPRRPGGAALSLRPPIGLSTAPLRPPCVPRRMTGALRLKLGMFWGACHPDGRARGAFMAGGPWAFATPGGAATPGGSAAPGGPALLLDPPLSVDATAYPFQAVACQPCQVECLRSPEGGCSPEHLRMLAEFASQGIARRTRIAVHLG